MGRAPEHGPLARHGANGWSVVGSVARGRRVADDESLRALSVLGRRTRPACDLSSSPRPDTLPARHPRGASAEALAGDRAVQLAGELPGVAWQRDVLR